jgi:hypothetical protein
MHTCNILTKCLPTLTIVMLCLPGTETFGAISASATVTTSQTTAPYTYSIALQNTGTTGIGSFWFAWDQASNYNFLPSLPTNVQVPANWGLYNTSHVFSFEGYGLEFLDNGTALAPNATLAGFQFTSNDSPATLQGPSFFTVPVTTSYVYPGFFEQAAGAKLIATVSVVPEPSTFALAGIGGLIGWLVRRRQRQQ